MSIDPRELDGSQINQELAAELAGLSADELERSMTEAAPAPPKADERGRLRGRIIEIRGGEVLIDVGGKSEAFSPIAEFSPEHPPVIGEVHTFMMQGLDRESGMMRLSLREARSGANIEDLRIGDVIEGRVTGLNIGGLELEAGGLRAFMPKSQVELHRVEDFAPFVGRRFECLVTEVDRKGRTLVLSRRRVLEKQREELRKQVRDTLAEGQVCMGVVQRITEFGAFVDIGGIEGLLHIGELSHARVRNVRDVLKEGAQVQVQILKLDHAKERISLGMKQLSPDPWTVVPANYRIGETVDGRVTKLMDFGAFVELSPGVEGLIPVSEISWTQRVRHPRDVLKEDDAVRVAVLALDLENRKITLSLKALGSDPWKDVATRYTPDSIVSGVVMRLTDFGAFVQLEEGVEGLVHISEMSDRRIASAGEVCKPGDVVKMRVKSVDPAQRRISLSIRSAVEPAPGAAPVGAGAPARGGAMSHAAPPPAKKSNKRLKGGLDG